jgi:transcriptional regulator with XRE-family HTH domain
MPHRSPREISPNDALKRYREKSGLTQQELSEKLNIRRATISQWERGINVPPSDILVELAIALVGTKDRDYLFNAIALIAIDFTGFKFN